MRKGTAKKVVKVSELSGNHEVDPDSVVQMSLVLSHPLYERLRKMSFESRTTVRKLITQSIENMLKKAQR